MLELNPEQKQAVEHGGGPLLVVAGPGTGKTRVITQRVVRLLESRPNDPESAGRTLRSENILALTFTEKAAQEMQRRVAEALPALKPLPAISTFHAFCLHTLREHQSARRLLDKTDVWIFLRQRMRALGLEYYQKLAEPGAFLHDLNEFFSRCQDDLIEPEQFESFVRSNEQDFLKRHPDSNVPNFRGADAAAVQLEWELLLRQKELARVFRTSRRLVEDAGASSLGSLVSDTVSLWRERPELLAEVRSRIRAVLVDEFQDTNYGQVELLKLLAGPGCSVTAVGDDDQAVYRFRGASHGAFEMFREAFPGHRTVYLTRNYRSTRKILRIAGTVIAQNDRFAQKPPLSAQADEGAPVYLLKALDAVSEAAWVASEIQRLARRGTALGGIAVLYRAHQQRQFLVEELRRRGVPFSIRGLSILSARIIRDLVAYLSLVHSADESISLTRVLLDSRWQFPAELAQTLRERAAKERRPLWRVIEASASLQPGTDAGTDSMTAISDTCWDDLKSMIIGLRAASKKISISALMEKLTERLGWRYVPGQSEQSYLETFQKFLERWEEKSDTGRLAEFMDYFRYFAEAGGKIEAPPAAQAADAVQMMTVHAAKGLEFPVVFTIGVSPRRFPATDRKPVIEFPQELRRGPAPPAGIHLQEERRLFFVAITRARQRVYISSISKSEKQQSQFVRDLLSDPAMAARDVESIDASSATAAEATNVAAAPEPLAARAAHSLGAGRAWSAAAARQQNLFGGTPANAATENPYEPALTRINAAIGTDARLRLSATSIENYRDCPLRYKFEHILKVPTAPQAALTFGSIMHQSARYYFERRRQSIPTFKEIEKFYLDHWRATGFDDEYHAETYREAGLEQLRAFVERHNALPFEAARASFEQAFRFELDGIAIEGRIDQMNLLDGEGEVELIDYKTGRPRTEKDAEKSLQLSVYALASRKLGFRPVRLTFYNFSNNAPVSAVRTAEELEATRREIREVAVGIREGRFEAKPGFVCRWCDFTPLCPAHEE